jgi:hypothetical protein
MKSEKEDKLCRIAQEEEVIVGEVMEEAVMEEVMGEDTAA